MMTGPEIAKVRERALTARQQAVFDWIRGFMVAKGYPPTLREIGKAFGISSTNGVNDHLRAIERKGYIRCEPSKSRAITIVDAPMGAATSVPDSDLVRLREDNENLRMMLKRMHFAVGQHRPLSSKLALLLGDVRAVLDGGAP
jgi:SOS-response transcriptional repressor LexA